jgi:hypothetical protein
MFVVGVGPQGDLRWYAPFNKGGAARAVAPGEVDTVLPELADTSAMPQDGHVTLHVLVSDEAFDAGMIERQLNRARVPLGSLAALDRLPVDVPLQARIDLTFTPSATESSSRASDGRGAP